MSAKRAAEALLEIDVELYAFSKNRPRHNTCDWAKAVREFLREYVAGTWTLTLAARAANVTEEQVVAAIFYKLGVGSMCVARGEAREILFQ